jgi:hypothetical protein
VRIYKALFGVLPAATVQGLVRGDVEWSMMPYLSEQYRIELLGVMICFSQTVLVTLLAFAGRGNYYRRLAYQKFRKLTAIESSSSQNSSSWGCAGLLLLLPWECDRFDSGAGRLGRACADCGFLE